MTTEVDGDVKSTIRLLGDDPSAMIEDEGHRLHTRLEPEMAAERDGKKHLGWWSKQRIWVTVIVGAMTVAVAIGAAVVVNGTGESSDRSVLATEQASLASEADPAAATFLRQAAEALERDSTEPVQVPRTDQWLYQKRGHAGGVTGHVEEPYDSWWSFTDEPDPDVPYNKVFESPRAVHQVYANLPEDTYAIVDHIYELADQVNLANYLASFPPGDAEERLSKEPWSQDLRAFMVIRTLLDSGAPTPHVQAKLYRALAEIPGIRDDGVIDAGEGGRVHAIRWDQDFDEASWPEGLEWGRDWDLAGRHQILIATDTHRLRGFRILDPDITTDSKQVGLDIVFDAAVVDSEGRRP